MFNKWSLLLHCYIIIQYHLHFALLTSFFSSRVWLEEAGKQASCLSAKGSPKGCASFCVSVISWDVKNYPKSQWLKTRSVFIGSHFVGQELGLGSVGMAYLCSCCAHTCQNWHGVTSTTFCWSEQVTRPSQVQGGRGHLLHVLMGEIIGGHFCNILAFSES